MIETREENLYVDLMEMFLPPVSITKKMYRMKVWQIYYGRQGLLVMAHR